MIKVDLPRFTYVWVIFKANVGKYSLHGACGTGYTIQFGDAITSESRENLRIATLEKRGVMQFLLRAFLRG